VGEAIAEPADSWLEAVSAAAPTVEAQAAGESPIVAVPGDTTLPENQLAAVPPVPRRNVLLPNTAGVPPSIALVGGLCGMALVIHGVRRVRRAAGLFGQQAAALGRLAALLEATAARHRLAQPETDQPAEACEQHIA
jgi:hypothetical protein